MRAMIVMSMATALLAACGSTQEMTAYGNDPVMALAGEYGPACERMGYGRESNEWRRCIAQSTTRADLARYAQFYDRYMAWYLLR